MTDYIAALGISFKNSNGSIQPMNAGNYDRYKIRDLYKLEMGCFPKRGESVMNMAKAIVEKRGD